MKKISVFLLLASSLFGHGPRGHDGDGNDHEHSTNPDHLEFYVGDFTDTDKDGMTDVAELKYGFNPRDSASVPNKSTSYFLDDLGISKSSIVDDEQVSSENDKVYFYFSKFDPEIEKKTRNFMIKLFPILYDRLGNPSRNLVCKLHNRGGNRGSWSASSSGTRIYTDDNWNPRLLVHEITHVWAGKYKFASSASWTYDKLLSGFEEISEGLAYEIIKDFIIAYPNDENSIAFVKGGAWDEWSGRFSNFDLVKHQRWSAGGDFWICPLTSNDRYNISAVLFQIFNAHDKDFYKKVMSKFYERINTDPSFRPNRDNIIDLWSSVVPYVNGIPSKQYLNAIPALNGRLLDNEFYAVVLPDGKFRNGGSQKLFCAFADSKRGEFWWSSSIMDSNINEFGIPSWFGKHKAGDNYYYTDNRKQVYVANVHTTDGEFVTRLDGELGNPTRSDGGPSTIASASPSGLRGKYYDLGLYKMTLEFPHYKDFTDHYKSDSYFFGYKDFSQSKSSERTIMIGIDCESKTDTAEMILNGQSYVGNLTNGAVIFNIPTFNEEGIADIKIHSSALNRTNTYKRAIIIGGTMDNYRHQPILIIDRDFDGNEDLYELYQEVVAFDNNDNNLDTNSSFEVITNEVDSNTDENSSLVTTTETNSSKDTSSEQTVDSSTENSNVVSNDTQLIIDVNSTWNDGVVTISWNEPKSSSLYLLLKHGETTIVYGGHYSDHAEFVASDHNLTGTETLDGVFLQYEGSTFIDYVGDFYLNLENIIPLQTIDIAVETNGTTVIIENVTSVEIDESNTTIVNTTDNVVLVENTSNISDITDENDTLVNDENIVVVSDDNVTLTTTNNDTYETNASDSVITITEEAVTIEEDSSKNVTFGGDAPSAPPVVKSAWDKAISIGNNWYYIDWFGYFFKLEGNGWLYHQTHGWIYTDWTMSFDNTWLYHESFGWVWTKNDMFPYLYQPNNSLWIYLVEGGYYDFNKNEWVKI